MGSWAEFLRLAALETDDCVLWPYAKAGQGRYGLTYQPGGVKTYTHRHALIVRGTLPPTPDHRYVIHEPVVCHQPLCLNYRHLRWGTPTENNLDRRRDGTSPDGERNPMSRLTSADAREVHALWAEGVPQRQLAHRFGVHVMTINRLLRGESWKSFSQTNR